MMSTFTINLFVLSRILKLCLPVSVGVFGLLGAFIHPAFYLVAFILAVITVFDLYYRYVQKDHALLNNFGILAQGRYLLESLGPELRQYFYMSDTEEKPFSREERAEVYRKAKCLDSTASFGSLKDTNNSNGFLAHAMFPSPSPMSSTNIVFGEERGCKQPYTITFPFMISAMSYGALGKPAVRALARGAKMAGIAMNTGEGGYPKYHLQEECDLIFQMGTAKFGVRHADGSLDEEKLIQLSEKEPIKMIEIKLSQGAKPGKGGLLPKEKLSPDIAELRGVNLGQDVLSPPFHKEAQTAKEMVQFIARVQELVAVPVGIKLCLGKRSDWDNFVLEMKRQNSVPDYIAVDGSEGGTGAAPVSFLDDVGMPLMDALPIVHQSLKEAGLRNRLKLVAGGKLINAAKQFHALALGADAVYSARGFMLALGCIQSLQCHMNTCPVGITTHKRELQKGLDIESKAKRVMNYVNNLKKEHTELLQALGVSSYRELSPEHLIEQSSSGHI